MNRLPVASVLFACTLYACTTTLHADSILVPVGGDIQAAIDLMGDGDTVQLEPGTYPLTGTLNTDGKALTLIGETGVLGQPVSVIDGQGMHRIIECLNGEGPGTVFENLFVRNGRSSAMYIVDSSPTLNNCVFSNNQTDGTGGVAIIQGGNVRFTDCRFIGNLGNLGGALQNDFEAETILVNCMFEGNRALVSAAGSGGAIHNTRGAKLVATDCSFIENRARLGGAIHNFEGTDVLLTNCTFTGNHAELDGGTIRNIQCEVTMDGCTLTGNSTKGDSSAIDSFESIVTLTDTIICDNTMEQIIGGYTDGGGNCIREFCGQCYCPADFDGNGQVDGNDLTLLLSEWGSCGATRCLADLTDDGLVDGRDLTRLLSAWGECD